MTINKAIANAALLHPDAFQDTLKAGWISELDGKIAKETMHIDDFIGYEFPRDGDSELLVQAPYDGIYELYIIAMSDFFSGELSNYSVSAILFDRAYDEFKKAYIRNHMPPHSEFHT